VFACALAGCDRHRPSGKSSCIAGFSLRPIATHSKRTGLRDTALLAARRAGFESVMVNLNRADNPGAADNDTPFWNHDRQLVKGKFTI